MDSLLLSLAIGLVCLVGFACAESGGGSAGGSSAASATGTASVFLTDAASDRFDEILITITSIEFRGNGDPVEVFSGRETINLKDLENFSDLFVSSDSVPVGSYSKIRLAVDAIDLVEDGEVTSINPPANGKIDLNPRGSFEIREGINLVIEIDMDAKKSIHVRRTGRRDHYRFRPVVFVTIRATNPPPKLARIHGEITELIDDMTFELCSTIFLAARSEYSRDDEYDADEGGIGDRQRCSTVELDEATGLFDSNGDPTTADTLRVGDEITVVGFYHLVDSNHDDMLAADGASSTESVSSHRSHHARLLEYAARAELDRESNDDSMDNDSDADSDSDDSDRPEREEIIFLAQVIEIGAAGTFAHLEGVIESALDEMDQFDFAIDPAQGFGDDSVVVALLQDGTRIFSQDGVEVDSSEIIPETQSKIDGVFAVDEMGTFLKTALLVLNLEIDGDTLLRGTISRTDEADREIDIDIDGVTECVDVPESAGIFLVGAAVASDTSSEGDFGDLMRGLRADVYGSFEAVGGCFVADTIIGFPGETCADELDCPVDVVEAL